VVFDNLTELRELYLNNNRIQYIGKNTFHTLQKLKVLSLDHNQLWDFPVWSLTSLASLSRLSVGSNAWPCDCLTVRNIQQLSLLPLLTDRNVACTTISGKSVSIGSLSNLTVCSESPVSQTVADINKPGGSESPSLAIMVCVVTAVTLSLVSLACLAVMFRTNLQVWLHSQYNFRLAGKHPPDQAIYDAFVSYSVQDEEYIQQVLVPHLSRHHRHQYRLCLQHRDLAQGGSIEDQWPAVQSLCSRVIVLLSRAFLTTQWQQIELLSQSVSQPALIVILLEDLTSLELASVPQLNSLLKHNTVLRWNQSGFWNKLRYYLPDGRPPPVSSPGKITSGPSQPGSGQLLQRQIRPNLAQHKAQVEWLYDFTDSSTSTRSTVLGSASPRSGVVAGGGGGGGGAGGSGGTPQVSGVVAEWSDSDYGGYSLHNNPAEHLYAHIPDLVNSDHLYHTLDQTPQTSVGNMLEVMLPSGEIVPATLVRNNKTGRVIPLVSVSPAPGSPVQQEERPAQPRDNIITTRYR